jgi:hypothetical protein
MTYANHVAMHLVMDSTAEIRAAIQRVRPSTEPSQSKSGKRRVRPSAERSAFPILLVIARHCNQQRECWLSFATIAEESMWSRRSVADSITILIKASLIEIIGQHSSRANKYRLLVQPSHQRNPRTSANVADDSANVADDSANVADDSANVAGDSANVADDSANVAGDSARIAHEVVPEAEKEVEKVNSTLKQYARSAEREGSGTKQSDFAPTINNQQQKPNPSSAIKAEPSLPAETPEAQLPYRYLELLGHPPAHRDAAATVWPHLFREMLGRYSPADLSAAIEWAFLSSPFWPEHLFRRKGDPVEYFAEKVDTIVSGWRSQKQKSNNTTTKPKLTPSQQAIADMFVYD